MVSVLDTVIGIFKWVRQLWSPKIHERNSFDTFLYVGAMSPLKPALLVSMVYMSMALISRHWRVSLAAITTSVTYEGIFKCPSREITDCAWLPLTTHPQPCQLLLKQELSLKQDVFEVCSAARRRQRRPRSRRS